MRGDTFLIKYDPHRGL